MDRFSVYAFNNGRTARNRVVVPPMASRTANSEGLATKQTIDHYENLSRSGAGLVLVEYSFIHITGKGESNQLGVDHENKVAGLSNIASAIRRAGAVSGIQLVHVGGKTTQEVTGAPLMGPGNIAVPVKDRTLEPPVPMSDEQIQLWQKWFKEAADRAVAAGFEIIELHSAHGYGLNQWLSPLTNNRGDLYGGGIRNRSRLLLAIAEDLKRTHPDTLLSVRLPGKDNLSGGLTLEEMAWVVSRLESAGVDIINVSSGIGNWRRPENRLGEGYLVADAAQLKSHTSLPVIGVGGIETGEFIDQIIQESKVDFAAVGRSILQDPVAWGSKNLK